MNMITNEVNIEDIGRGGIALYQTPDGRSNLEVKLENDTLWLSVAQMSQLFGRDRTVIQRHLNNIFKEGELEREMRLTNKGRPLLFYERSSAAAAACL